MTAEPRPTTLPFTGERFTHEVIGEIWHEHWHRYVLALPLARGKRVLDAACGEGYGSAFLATAAREVVGVDVAPDAIAHASARYAAENLRFAVASCTELPLADESFDLVVSFETIEHLAEQSQMLAEFRRVLAPEGILVISSPNRPVYAAQCAARNEFHVRELTRDELAQLLTPVFPEQCWYGQAVVVRSAVWREGRDLGEPLSLITFDGRSSLCTRDTPASPMYFIVVGSASGVTIPKLPGLSLFGDHGQTLLEHLRNAAQLHRDERDARKIANEREARLVETVNALRSEQEVTAALNDRIGELDRRLERAEGDLQGLRNHLAWRESWRGWVRWPGSKLRARWRPP